MSDDADFFVCTPDDKIEKGVEEFKRLWPQKWKAWIEWCQSESKDIIGL